MISVYADLPGMWARTVTSLILHNIITTSNGGTNLVSNPLSNASPQQSNEAY